MCGKINTLPGAAAADGEAQGREAEEMPSGKLRKNRPTFSKTAHLPDMYHVSAAPKEEGKEKGGRIGPRNHPGERVAGVLVRGGGIHLQYSANRLVVLL